MYKKNVTDEEIKADYDIIFESEIRHFLVPRVILENEYADSKVSGKGNKSNTSKDYTQITEDEKMLLENIYYQPNLTVTKRSKGLHLTPYRMNDIKKKLLEKGLIGEFQLSLGKKNSGNPKILVLIEKGYEAIGKIDEYSKPYKKESLEHLWVKKQLKDFYDSMNIPAWLEKSKNGKHSDVVVRKGAVEIAIEYERSADNGLTNILRDLTKAGFDRVISISKNQKIMDEIVQQFKNSPDYLQLKDQVEFKTLLDLSFIQEILKKDDKGQDK